MCSVATILDEKKRRFIRPLGRLDAKQRPRKEKLTIVRALPGISRRLELLERIYGRFPSADRIDCFVRVPNLGKYI